MNSTANPKALLPHEMNEIARIFSEILSERGLPRDCEAAEAIAARLLSCYQEGIRESGALKYTVALDLRSVSNENADIVDAGSPEVSMRQIAGASDSEIGPDNLEMLQRTFDRVCIWCNIPRYGKRADRLARSLTAQFRKGMSDETSLFEHAMWLEQRSDPSRHRPDA